MMRQSGTDRRRARPGGFTLIELGIVMVIIGILVGLILAAGAEGVRRSEVRATQALIAKLEVGLSERLEAILSRRVEPNGAHRFLAAIFPPPPSPAPPVSMAALMPWGLEAEQRAQVIARFDYLKAEMPDVFYFNSGDTYYDADYPLNFAARPYPLTGTGRAAFVLPLGNSVPPGFNPPGHGPPYSTGPKSDLDPDGDGVSNVGPGAGIGGAGYGIYGATYFAAGAVYKNLGYAPQGYDGADNDNDGWIDELDEGIGGNEIIDPEAGLTRSQVIAQHLKNHTHKTARSEMLYALLVEGIGPLGSVFTRDDFGPNEVADSDNDGLPEFVDAWGEPIQYFRWPIHYRSTIQRGMTYYPNQFAPREQDPLDANQLLVAPSWWISGFNVGSYAIPDPFPAPAASEEISGHAWGFCNYFHTLNELRGITDSDRTAATYPFWDRSKANPRRAYFSRFLVLSAGPNRQLGVPLLATDYELDPYFMPSAPDPVPINVEGLILIENNAAPVAPNRVRSTPYFLPDTSDPQVDALGAMLAEWGADDIANQTFRVAEGGIQ